MEADGVEAGIRRQTGLGAGGAIEHGGQARLLDGLEHRHLLRDAAPGTRQELLPAVGKVHAAREVDGASKAGLGHLLGDRLRLADFFRSDGRRVGKECGSKCRNRWSTLYSKKK